MVAFVAIRSSPNLVLSLPPATRLCTEASTLFLLRHNLAQSYSPVAPFSHVPSTAKVHLGPVRRATVWILKDLTLHSWPETAVHFFSTSSCHANNKRRLIRSVAHLLQVRALACKNPSTFLCRAYMPLIDPAATAALGTAVDPQHQAIFLLQVAKRRRKDPQAD